jgi:mRNA interferase MazF
MRRGEVWTANLNPGRGREIGKIRPVLIIQADELIEARDRLREACQVVVDQPRALDRERVGDGPLTILTRTELAAVERGLRVVLGMYKAV